MPEQVEETPKRRVTSYNIEFKGNSGEWFDEAEYCPGTRQRIIIARACSIPLEVLMAEPFLLERSDTIEVRVTARNMKTESEASEVGGGAVIPITPSAPMNLERVEADCILVSEDEV